MAGFNSLLRLLIQPNENELVSSAGFLDFSPLLRNIAPAATQSAQNYSAVSQHDYARNDPACVTADKNLKRRATSDGSKSFVFPR